MDPPSASKLTPQQIKQLKHDELLEHVANMTTYVMQQTQLLEAKRQENFNMQKEIQMTEIMIAEIDEQMRQPNLKLEATRARLQQAKEARRKTTEQRNAASEKIIRQIEEQEQQLQIIKQQVTAKKKQLQRQQKPDEIDDIPRQIQQLSAEIDQMNEEYDYLQLEAETEEKDDSEEQELDERIQYLQEEVDALNVDIDEKRKEREIMNEELDKLKKDIEAADSAPSEIAKQGNSMFAEIHDYCETMRRKTKKMQEAVQAIRRTNADLRNEIERVKRDNARRQVDSKEVTICKYETEVSELSEKIEKLVKLMEDPAVFKKDKMVGAVQYVETLYNTRERQKVDALNNMAKCVQERLALVDRLWDVTQRLKETKSQLDKKQYESACLKADRDLLFQKKKISTKCICNNSNKHEAATSKKTAKQPKMYVLNVQKLLASKSTTLAEQVANRQVE